MRYLHQKNTVAEMIGKKFNRLTVVGHVSRYVGYLCVCDCGSKTTARSSALKSGRHASCGCLPKRLKQSDLPARRSVMKNYKAAAKRRGYSFKLSSDEFFVLIGMDCYYCGAKPSLKVRLLRHQNFRYNGVDRVDNVFGYMPENSVACCKICNISKSILSTEEWMAWIKRVYDFNFSKNL